MKRAVWLTVIVAVGCAQNQEPIQQQAQQQVQATSPPTDQRPVIVFWNGDYFPNGPAVIKTIASELIDAANSGDKVTMESLLKDAVKTFAGVDDPARGGDAVGSESEVTDDRYLTVMGSATVPSGTKSQSVSLVFTNTSDASTSGDQEGSASQTSTATQDVKAAIELGFALGMQAQNTQGGGGVGGTGSATGGAMDLESVIEWINAHPDKAAQIVEGLKVAAEKVPSLPVPTIP